MSQQRKQQLTQGTGNIKFPCSCFIEWKTTNGKDATQSSNRVKLIQKKLQFNQKIALTTHMVIDSKTQIYLKKESVVILNLVSNLSPNEPKLVGRITVQLSSVANQIEFQQLKQYALQFCSVDATLTFKVSLKQSKTTTLAISELQRSEYSELGPIVSQRQIIKEDKQRSAGGENILKGIGSTNITTRKIQNVGQTNSNIRQNINRLKTQNQNIIINSKTNNSSYLSRVKRQTFKTQIKSNSNIDNNVQTKEVESSEANKNNGLLMPQLSKNIDEFDSNKILSQQRSYQSAIDSPLKNEHISQHNKIQQLKHQEMEFKIKDLQGQLRRLQLENYIKQQLQDKYKLAIRENKQQTQQIQSLRKQVTEKDKQIAFAIEDRNQIQYFKQIIQQKDKQIQQLSVLNRQQYQQFQQIEHELQDKIQQTTQEISIIHKNMKEVNQTDKQSKQAECLKQNIEQLNQIIIDLNCKLQAQQVNHQNSKLQLKQVREWYSDLQQQSDHLNLQNQHLKSQLEECKHALEIYIKKNANQVTGSSEIKIKQQQSQLAQKDKQIAILHQILQKQQDQKKHFANTLENVRKQLDDLQIKYIEQQSNLHSAESKAKEHEELVKSNQRQIQAHSRTIREKSQQIQENKRKLNDLIKRIKQKQQNLLKTQRQSQIFQQKCKISQSNAEKYKEKLKILENQKEADKQKIKTLQKQNRQLKNKSDKDNETFNKEIKKLQLMLETQTNKRTQVLSQIQNKARNNQNGKINDLQTKIKKYIQKEKLLKQCINNLQEQSNKISIILQQKQDNQDQFTNNIIALTQQNHHLTSKINQLSNQCLLLHQRNQGLQSEIQLLNAYQPNQEENSETMELNKKLVEKNKELLLQIQQRNQHIVELQTSQAQMKGKQAHQILSSSRQERERQDYIQKYQEVVEENQKLYVEFEKLNQKYQDQLNESNQINQNKIINLQTKINEKVTQFIQFQNKSKEQSLKLQRKISQQQYQLQYYANQIKQLTDNVFHLKVEINNRQQKLELAENHIKQLSQKIESIENKHQQLIFTFNKNQNASAQLEKGAISPKSLQKDSNHEPSQHKADKNVLCEQLQEQINHLKCKLDFYQAEIERLHEKQFIQQKEILQINQRLDKFKVNSEEQQKHISYLQSQLKNCREKQFSYIQQIDSLQESQNILKTKCSSLQKEINEVKNYKSQLNQQIQKLNDQIQSLKENKLQSQQSTPINKFKHSPKNSQIDIKDIFTELDGILVRRKQEQELENALRLVIDNNTRQEEEFQRWSKQRGMIQEKAKIISKQLQKIKSNIMKTSNRSIAQKAQIAYFLKPAEAVVNDLINLSEHLNELDPYEEQQQFEGESLNNNSPR